MMRYLALSAAAALALVAARAGASIPGNTDQRGRAGLIHVCAQDTEPGDADYVVCNEQEGGDPEAAYTASECVTAGLDPVCVVDFVPKVRIKATLLLILDDTAEDSGGGSFEESAIILQLKLRGKKQTLIELFDGSKIGNWNGFAENFLADVASQVQFSNVEGTEFQFASENLTNIGNQIRDLAAAAFTKSAADIAVSVPVVTSIARDPKQPPLDHSVLSDPLATGASFRVVIEFARTRP
jgi:hypothetical protein